MFLYHLTLFKVNLEKSYKLNNYKKCYNHKKKHPAAETNKQKKTAWPV